MRHFGGGAANQSSRSVDLQCKGKMCHFVLVQNIPMFFSVSAMCMVEGSLWGKERGLGMGGDNVKDGYSPRKASLGSIH